MPDGTALLRFKRAFIEKLQTRADNVSYESPMQPEDMLGEDGSGLACWFDDAASAAITVTVLAGAGNFYFDETWNVPFRIQALGLDTDATQESVDALATGLLGEVMALFADPSFGIADDTIQIFAALPVGSSSWFGGVLPSNFRAARFELGIELTARINVNVGS